MSSELTILETAQDADERVSDAVIDETLGWFEDERGVPSQEFIDRLCDTYADGWDMESYDNAAARRILARARAMKRGSSQ